MKRTQIFLACLLTISLCLNFFLLSNGYLNIIRNDVQDDSQGGHGYLSIYDQYIDDAKQRWLDRNPHSEDPFRNRIASLVTLDDRICISFEYSQPDIGGVPPFYCYDVDAVRLISKRDEVE